jgi:predicted Zn-dependent protease
MVLNGWSGRTTVTYNTSTDLVTKADVQINFSYCDSFGNNQRQKVIAHEYGHVMGLNHAYYLECPRVMHSNPHVDDIVPTSKDITSLNKIY